MPTGIEQFCEKLLPLNIYSAEDILKHHTLLPYFSLVLPSERMQNTRVKMLQLSNAGAQGQLGTLASTVKNFRFLRFCPQCVEDDRQYMGAAYWHRVHQLPGVLVCPFHECPTFNSQVDKQHTAYQLYASAEKYAKENARQSKLVVDDKLLSIAQASAELLRSYQPHAKLETYRNQLLSLGFNHGGNAINQKMLAEGFIRYWEVERLEKLGITTNFYKESQWLRFITRKAERGSQFQPLQHILIRLFIQSLKQSDVHPGIKASSPETIYSCPNSFCDQKEKLSAKVINTHHSKKKGATYGVIECKCGFT
ncbi:TniQ family protein, partial [Thalassotalea sp. G20_0]|uniref:TnsD family Tn7-like transposition protein n=1 Tax=Thalassotalea sp. G20_0 TaxID=2821093 RepID=UPI001ADAA326